MTINQSSCPGEVVLEEEEEVMGIMSPEYAWSAAIGGFILSALMMICACCLCDTWLFYYLYIIYIYMFFLIDLSVVFCVFLSLPEGRTW